MSKRIRTILQYIFFLGLGIFLVWLSVKDIDAEKWGEIKASLRDARFYLVIPVFAILFLSHYVRALRWRLLMEPLGYKPSRSNVFFAVMIGYLANQAFPRLGEVLKCTVLARYEKLPADKLVGTIVLERLIDAISLLLIFALTLAVQPGLYSQLVSSDISTGAEKKEAALPGYIIPLAIIVLGIIGVVAWMVIKKKTINDLVLLFKSIVARVWQGLTTIRHLRKRKQFVFLTILLWVCYIAGGYIGFFALRETQHYGFREALTVLSAGSVGMIVTPGGIGAYAYLIENTMHKLYHLNANTALAFGWLLWLAQTAVVLIGGLISLIALPIYNRKRISRVSKVSEVPGV